MDADVIGGGRSTPKYAFWFAIGAVFGTTLRVGMWLLPARLVEFVKDFVR